MRKLLSLSLVFGLLTFATLGCSKDKNDKSDGSGKKGLKDTGGGTTTDWDDDGRHGSDKKGDDDKKGGKVDDDRGKKEDSSKDKPTVKPKEGDPAGPVLGKRQRFKKEQQSGLLTAGSFDDNLHPEPYRTFVKKLGQDNQYMSDLPPLFLGHRLIIAVRGRDGKPVGNARVRVRSAGGGAAVNLVTRSDGSAVFVSSWDKIAADDKFAVTVTPPDGSAPVKQLVPRRAARWQFTLPAVTAPLPKKLDLTLVLDTTGSMGDELEYLKAEIKSIARAVNKKFPSVDQRYALVLYRDDGDHYVARTFQFTSSLDQFCGNLSRQNAGGGGDYPEAMHRGLEEAVNLHWRDGDTARVLFLVADAPPHTQHAVRTMTAIDRLRKKGVAIYPVAASGADDACEFVMRTAAMLTGGQYLFLTNDSGVGDAHGEPHIPYYQVQRLDQLMIRMIASELAGRRIDPLPKEILRTVGRPINVPRKK